MVCNDCGTERENVYHPSFVYCRACLGHSMHQKRAAEAEDTPRPPHDIADTPAVQHRDIHRF